MEAKELWNRYCCKYRINENTNYEAWAFGDDSDRLLDLVMRKIKTSTSSAYDLYIYDNEPLPKEFEYSVILNSKGEAKCVIRTTKVYLTKFSDVTSEHAYKEGEGDRTLKYWKNVHERFFKEEYQNYPLIFSEDSLIVCEEFKLVYSND